MKTRTARRTLALRTILAGSIAALLGGHSAQAATVYYDSNTGTGSFAGSFWSPNSTGGADVALAAGSDVIFSSTAVTLSGLSTITTSALALNSLAFNGGNTGGYTFTNAGIITLGNATTGNTIVSMAAGTGAVTFAGQITLAAGVGQTYTIANNSSSLLSFNGNILQAATNQTLAINGAGTGGVTFNGGLQGNNSGNGFNGQGNVLNLSISGGGVVALNAANIGVGNVSLVASGALTLGNTLAMQGFNLNQTGGTFSFGTLTSAQISALSGSSNLVLTNASSTAVALTVAGFGSNNAQSTGGSSPTFSGGISGLGGLTFSGVQLTNRSTGGTATYSGNLSMSGGVAVSDTTISGTTGGTSTVILSGLNTYGGQTTLTSANLQAQDPGVNNFIKALSTTQVNLNGGTLQLRADGSASSQTIITGNGTTGNNVVVGGTTTIDVNRRTANTGSTIQFNNLTIGAQTLSVTGGNSYGLQFAGTTTLTGNAIFNIGTAPLTLTGAIGDGGSAFGITKSGTGTVTLSGASTYTGATTLGTAGSPTSVGTLTLSGASGSIATSSGISIIGSGTKLLLDNSVTNNNDRIGNNVTLSLGAELALTGNGATASTTEVFGVLGFGAATSTVTISGTGTGQAATLAGSSLSRTNNGTGFIRATNFGNTATNVGKISLSGGAPTGANFVGGGAPAGTGTTKSLSIVPWLFSSTSATATAGTDFVTYDTTLGSLRGLVALEYDANTIALATAGNNVKDSTTTETAIATKTINSLLLVPTATQTITGAGGGTNVLTITSGALASSTGNTIGTTAFNSTISGFDSVAFGNGEAVITVAQTGGTITLNSQITSGGGLTKAGAGTLTLGANNTYTGATTINAGTLNVGGGAATGDLGSSTAVALNGGNITFNRTANYSTAATITGVTGLAGTITQSLGAGTLTVGTVNGSNLTVTNNTTTGATGALTMNQSGTGLTISTIGGASGSVVNFGGTGTTAITNILNTTGQTVSFNGGTVNLNGFGNYNSTLIVNTGATVNTVNTTSNGGNYQRFPNLQVLTGGTLNVQAVNGLRLGTDFGVNNGATNAAVGVQSGGNIVFTNGSGLSLGGNSGTFVTSFGLSGGIFNGSAANSFLLIDAATGGGSSTFNFGGGTLRLNNTIAGTRTGAAESFAWTAGTLAVAGYNATNLSSTLNTVVSASTNTLTNNGTGILAPGDIGTAGLTTITGNYTQGSTAFLAVDLGGTTVANAFQNASGSFDKVTISGTTSLAGTLTVNILPGFRPANANTFGILTSTGALTAAAGSFVIGTPQTIATNEGFSTMTVTTSSSAVTLGGYAITNQWKNNVSGNWGTGGTTAWTGATDPNSSSAGALFINNPGTVTLDASRTVKNITFAPASGAFTISTGNASTLTLDSGSTTLPAVLSNAIGNNTISTAIVLNSAVLAGAASGTTLTLGGPLSGVGALNASGAGTVSLVGGANTYTGATTVAQGTLSASNIVVSAGSSGLGNATSAVTLGNAATQGTLSYTGTSNTFTRGLTIGGAGGGRLDVTTSGQLLTVATGDVTGAGLFTVGGLGNTTISSNLTHTAGLTKADLGTLTLSGTNTFTGTTTVSSGILNIQNATGLGTTAGSTSVSNGATLQLQGGITIGAEALSLNGGAASGQTGALENVSGTNTYGGAITVTSSSSISALSSTILNLTGGIVKNGTVATLTGGGTINIGTLGISGINANSDLVVNGVTVNLNVANTYNGPTFIRSGGVINATVADALPTANGRTALTMDDSGTGSSSLALTNAGQFVSSLTGASSTSTINLNNQNLTVGTASGSTTFAGVISGATGGSLTKDGGSTLILSGPNTYTGATTISAGTLSAGVTGNLGAAASNLVFDGGTLQITGTTLTSFSGIGHTVVFNAAKTVGLDINNAANTFTAGQALNQTSGGLTKSGAGTLILNQANTYTGATSVNAGELRLTGGALNNTTISVGGTGTLSVLPGAGSYTAGNNLTAAAGAALNVATGGIVSMVDGSIGTFNLVSGASFTTPGITLAGSIFNLELNSAGVDRITFSGNAVAAAISGTNTINITTLGSSLTAGTYDLITATGIGAGNTFFKFSNSTATMSFTVGSLTYGLTLQGVAGIEQLVVGAGLGTFTWTGQTNGTGVANSVWTATPAGNNNFANQTPAVADYVEPSIVTFQDLNTITSGNVTNSTVTIAAAGVNPNSVTVNNAAVNYTFQNASGTIGIAGATGLTKSGTGTLTLNGANTYTGGTIVNQGTLTVGTVGALGAPTGVLTVNNTNTTAAGTATVVNLSTTAGTTTGTLSGSISTPTSGTNTATINNGGQLYTVNQTAPGTYAGVIAGAGGFTLGSSSTNTLTLSGLNTYTGGTIVNQGTLTVGGTVGTLGATTGVLTVNNTNTTGAGTATVVNLSTTAGTTTGTLSGSISTPLSGTNTATINNGGQLYTVNQTAPGTYAGVIAGAGGFTLGSLSTNTLTLSGLNTYAGATSISAGTLTVSSTGSLGAGALTLSSTGVLNLNNTAQTVGTLTTAAGTTINLNTGHTLTVAGTAGSTLLGAIAGQGALVINQNGQQINLNASNTFSGGLTLKAGTISMQGASSTTPLGSGTISLGDTSGSAATITLSNGGAGNTFSNAINVVSGSSGAVTLETTSGALTFNGLVTLARNLALSNTNNSGSNLTLGGGITGTGNITATGVNGGSSFVLSGATAINITGTISNLSSNAGGSLTISAPITGAATALLENSTVAAPMILTGANNTYGGSTTIQNGILTAGATNTLSAATTVTLGIGGAGNTATLNLGNGTTSFNQTVAGLSALGTNLALNTITNNDATAAFANTATLTVNPDGAATPVNSTFDGLIKNGASSKVALTKAGSLTLTLTGANTYTGLTTVSGGTLSVATLAAGATAQPLGANTGLTLGGASTAGTLQYTGGAATLDKAVTVAAGGGTISNTGGALLTLTGGLSKSGSTLTLKPGAGGISVTTLGITGSAANSDLIIDGGVTTISVASTYNGPTFIRNTATLNANVANALPTANGRSAVTFDGTGTSILSLGVGQAVASLTAAGSATITLGANTLTVGSASGSTTFAGVISGTNGALTKDGASTQVLTGANTYSGATSVNNGTLAFNSVAAGGAAQALGANATVNLGVAATSSGLLQYTGAADTLDKTINVLGNGTDTIQNSGSGLLTLTGTLTKTGTTLTLKGGANGITVSGTGNITGNTGSANSDLIIDGGVTTLASANTYNGPTFIRNTATLNANVANALPTANGRSAVTFDGTGTSILSLGASQAVASLTAAGSATITLGANTLTVGSASGSTTFAGVISGTNGALTKDGASTQVLSGANLYTGTTTVSAGTLKAGVISVANTSGAFGNNSAVSMANVALATLDITGFNTQIGSLTGGGATGGNVTLGAATLTVGGDNTSPAAYAGVISGTGGALTKIGSGTLTLSGLNTYTGTTTINAGTVTVSSTGSLGTGALTLSGATAALNLNNTAQTVGTLGTVASSTITLGIGHTLTVAGTAGSTLLGAIAGQGALVVNQSGQQINFNAPNSFSGGLTVKAGTINLGLSGGSNSTSLGSGAITLGDTSGTANATISLNDFGAPITFSNAINVVSGSSGTVTLDTTSGALTFNGLVTLARNLALTNSNGAGSNLTLGGGVTGTGNIAATGSAGGSTFVLSGATAINITGTISNLSSNAGGSLTISAPITGAATALLENSTVAAPMILTGANNTYGGSTTIQNGILTAGATNTLSAATSVTLGIGGAGNTATLNLGNGTTSFNQTVAGLSALGTNLALDTITNNDTTAAFAHTATLTVNPDGAATPVDSTFGGVIMNGTSSKVALTKAGSRILTLTGANTYTGATTISGGTLAVSGNISATSSISLTAGTLLLTGSAASGAASNRINDAASVTLNGGGLKVDNTFTSAFNETFGALTLSSASTLDFGASPTTAVHLTFDFGSTAFAGHYTGGTLNIANWTGTENVAGGEDQLLFTNLTSVPDQSFLDSITFSGHGPGAAAIAFGTNSYEIVAVPEPSSTAWIGAAALLGLVGFRERRRLLGARRVHSGGK